MVFPEMEEKETTPAAGDGESPPARILIVDDERNILRSLSMILEAEGYRVATAASGEAACELLAQDADFDCAIVDLRLPGIDGIETLKRIRGARELPSSLPVLMISGHATLQDAVEAVTLGASDFFEKPLDRDRVLITLRRTLEKNRMLAELRSLHARLGRKYEIVGGSAAMRRVLAEVEKVAPAKVTVLVTGESGVGKELVAWAIHRLSPRAERGFVKVNCAAIPSELIESELFGYEKGSFTGAVGSKKGQFELASGGTLFFDEIGDMSLPAQAKVLRALQSGEITRVGGESPLGVDVRVVAATNHDIEKAVEAERFRKDLYFRLNVIRIRVPPLRERPEDIEPLVGFFVREFCRENNFRQKTVTPGAMERLRRHAWPGNVRELKNVAERLVIMSGDVIGEADAASVEARALPARDTPAPRTDLPLREYREEMERALIIARLQETGWSIAQTAQLLGIDRTNLYKKMKQLGISRGD